MSVAGTVINGEHIRGCLTIRAANVVVRNSRIDCAGGHGIDSKASNVTLINLDISCGNTPYKGVVGWGFSLVASDIRGCEDGVYIDRDVLVKDSYIHDLYEQVTGDASDPYGHTDGIQVVNEADRVWLQGNFVDNDTDHATSGYIGDGPNMDDIVIVGNYFTGAGYTVRCSQSGVRNVVQDNTIERGYHGWWTYCTRSGIVRSGNTLI